MPDTFSAPPGVTMLATRPTGSGAILGMFSQKGPPPQLTLPIAERVRAALMRASGSEIPWQIVGKDADRRPRRGHDHLYILPFSRGTSELDRVLLWASGGLEDATMAVLERLAQRGGVVQRGGGLLCDSRC